MSEKKQLTSADIRATYWRSTFLLGSFNFERMQSMGFCVSMIPTIKRLYSRKEDQAAALKRHLEFFNTQPWVGSAIMGVTAAMEQERANGAEIDDAAISGVKVGLMGPLAGVGDPIFWGTLRPVLAALGAGLAISGSILGHYYSLSVLTFAVRLPVGTASNTATKKERKSFRIWVAVACKKSRKALRFSAYL